MDLIVCQEFMFLFIVFLFIPFVLNYCHNMQKLPNFCKPQGYSQTIPPRSHSALSYSVASEYCSY